MAIGVGKSVQTDEVGDQIRLPPLYSALSFWIRGEDLWLSHERRRIILPF